MGRSAPADSAGQGAFPPAMIGHALTAEAARVLAFQGEVLQAIAGGAPLDAVLSAACTLVEELDPTLVAGILILTDDGQRFARAVGASLPQSFLDALRDWPLQSPEHHCPCAVALVQNDTVFSADMASDTRWSDGWRALTAAHELRASLSYPIVDPFGTPRGTLFAASHEPANDASRWNLDVLHVAARLAELAVDREQCGMPAWQSTAAPPVAQHPQAFDLPLTQMQRMEALGQLTAGVAHDFNNLLTVVLGNLDYVEQHASEWSTRTVQFARRLSFARLAAEHGAKLIAKLLAFSRRQQLEPKDTDVNTAIVEMRLLLQSTLSSNIDLHLDLTPDVWTHSWIPRSWSWSSSIW